MVFARKKTFSILASLTVFVAAGFWLLNHCGLLQAQNDGGKWKNFTEGVYGFSVDYPADWGIDANYDQYAPGIISAEMHNKECGGQNQCGFDCVDIRILAAKKEIGGKSHGLLLQLYEDFMMVRDFADASLVKEVDLAGKKAFELVDNQATLALNGRCGGPFYVFETEKHFVYIFTGYGADIAEISGEAKKIIESVKVD